MFSFLRRYFNCLRNFINYGSFDKPVYIIFEDQKLIFIAIPKCGKTSIMFSLASLLNRKIDISKPYLVHDLSFPRLDNFSKQYLQGDYTIFTVIRNPLDRLISCYFNQLEPRLSKKYVPGKYNLLNYLFGYFKFGIKSLDDFLRRIVILPFFLMDPHFRPMYKYIGTKEYSKILFLDLDNLESEFEPIRLKFNLPHLHKLNSSCYGQQDFHISQNTLNRVKRKYKEDYLLYQMMIQKKG